MMKIFGGRGASGFVSAQNHNLYPAKRAHKSPGMIVGGMNNFRNTVYASQERNSETAKADGMFPLSGPSPERFKIQDGQTNNVRQHMGERGQFNTLFLLHTLSSIFHFFTRIMQIVMAALGTILRFGTGALAIGYGISIVKDSLLNASNYTVAKGFGFKLSETSNSGKYPKPEIPLVLFDAQNDPGCRAVRESLSILDLDCQVYPCPSGGPSWESKTAQYKPATKNGLPGFYDPNSGLCISGDSAEIVDYLFRTYGNNKVPFLLQTNKIADLTLSRALSLRNGAGSHFKGDEQNIEKEPIVLWAYEASPFCVIVKEAMNELAIPYIQRSCARGSPKRQELFEERNHFQVPYIEDPNEECAMFESQAIVAYLKSKYGNST